MQFKQAATSRRSSPLSYGRAFTPARSFPNQRNQPRSRGCRLRAAEEVTDVTYDLVARYEQVFRTLPLWAGGLGFAGILSNRILSGIAPVVDASSAQSRADVLGIALSAALLLTGLQWLSIKPKKLTAVEPDGDEVMFRDPSLTQKLSRELDWTWAALQKATRARSLVVFYGGKVLFHSGFANKGSTPGDAKPGEVVLKAQRSETGNYLANLVLYPGRLEFVEYLPANTQGVVVQPIGSNGALVVGTDTVRGIGRLDQAWIASIADKLEVSFEGFVMSGTGFGAKAKSGRSR